MRMQRWFTTPPRLWGLLCGLTLAVAQFFSPAGAGTAQAATTTCTPNGAVENCTVTFAYSGAPESWAVPTGVTNVSFEIYGAQGGSSTSATSAAGGNGGATKATLAVTPGQTLQINVGGQGGFVTSLAPSGGGFNGGGNALYAGSASGWGGGGASDVRWDDPSVSGAFTLAERLLVAGGGGAASFLRKGGAGGGLNGTDGDDGIGGEGGGGGSQTAGGAGGQCTTDCSGAGDSGSFGVGGTGGTGGGGGGGGYYGGGGGSGPSNGGVPSGGGGGSGFGPAGATFETGVRAGNGLAILSYARDTAAPVANPTQSPAAAPSGWNNSNVTVSWNWTDSGSGIDPANCTTSSVSSGSGTINLSATCKDLAGNTGTATYQVKVDPTAPTANPSQSPAANGAGWNNTDVTVNWNWTFTGAIIDTANCTTSSTSSGEGTLTLSATCKDVALNQRTATYVVKVDKTAPVITGSRATPANSEGWNNSAVTVDFTCQEQGTGSGVATNTVGGVTLSTQGANQTATNSGACVDVAGNVAAPATVSAINIDLTKPTISVEVSIFANANGWFKQDVPISFLCDDALSGIATCPPDEILSSEGTAVSSTPHTSSDKAGNVSDPSNIVTVKIDKTAPVVTVTGVSNGATYTLGSVPTAACSTSDALSGVAAQATLSVSGGNPDGTGNFTATCSGATDLAGNSAAGVSVSYSVTPPPDTTAPVITAQVNGTLGNNGWYVSDVTVSWSVVDAESTINSQSGCETQNVTSDTAGVTFTCSATSAGGTASESVTVKRDATAPTISAAATSAPNANGWYNSNVTVQFTCNDNLSGVTSCPTDEILSSEGAAVSSTAQTITDEAGNSSAASNVVTVQIDKTAPVVTVTGVSNGASYTVGSVPAAGCSTSDALSGVATQATVNVTGGNADGTGSFTATCSGATDNAGNSAAPVSVSYSVSAVAGVLVGVCGGYEVRQVGSSYSAAGWSGAIKVGTNGNNTLKGANSPDLILGLGGNDKIDGKGGDDVLCGGDGVDLLLGMAGNDHLDGGAGNDVLNGGSGDYDELVGGEGNDVLLDGDGVRNASGGAGSDLFTLALRNGWRNGNGQARFAGLSGGYGNDAVGLAILNPVQFFVDISGDERDTPASPLEGANDKLALAGVIDPASTIIKFEQQLVLSADATVQIPDEEAGAEYLSEPVGDERTEDAGALNNQLFLPLINR